MNHPKKKAKLGTTAMMTLPEVAEYLRLSKDTVYRMANTGKLPGSKVGNQWRFRKEDVDRRRSRIRATIGSRMIGETSSTPVRIAIGPVA